MLLVGCNKGLIFRSLGSSSIRKAFKTPSRCFQSRAEYLNWTKRMISSRLTLPVLVDAIDEDMNPTKNVSSNHHKREIRGRLVPVSVKAAAPFLYSVSPISDRLLLYEYEHKNAGDEMQKRYNESISNSSHSGRSPFDSMLECVYPLSESRYDDRVEHKNEEDTEHHTSNQDQNTNSSNKTMNKNDLDILRASVSDLGSWSSFRLAKFYSDVDALTADVAYRHARTCTCADADSPKEDEQALAFVTAGHYYSRKMKRTDITKDLILRCYPTNTGSSSMEIRTDAIQINEFGVECLINVCFTSMVAVDQTSLRPMKNVIPPLVLTDEEELEEQNHRQIMRSEMAKEHATIRKARFATTMQLRHGSSSAPPTQQEMGDIHSLHQQVISEQQNQKNLGKGESSFATPCLQHVHQHTYRSSVVVYPERRNVHGKLFGGFVMEQSHSLAQYAANFYLNHYHSSSKNSLPTNAANHEKHDTRAPGAIPLGMDEAIFLQPISIGDHVTFTARVVHSTSKTCRVLVIVEVRDPSDRHALPMRSNRVSYLFGTDTGLDIDSEHDPKSMYPSGFPERIVPNKYNEILMHVDAKRRSNMEGPTDTEVEIILSDV